jgi:hypothetical protein
LLRLNRDWHSLRFKSGGSTGGDAAGARSDARTRAGGVPTCIAVAGAKLLIERAEAAFGVVALTRRAAGATLPLTRTHRGRRCCAVLRLGNARLITLRQGGLRPPRKVAGAGVAVALRGRCLASLTDGVRLPAYGVAGIVLAELRKCLRGLPRGVGDLPVGQLSVLGGLIEGGRKRFAFAGTKL